jgi:hypothetical protein
MDDDLIKRADVIAEIDVRLDLCESLGMHVDVIKALHNLREAVQAL